jgi:hypothetical protein
VDRRRLSYSYQNLAYSAKPGEAAIIAAFLITVADTSTDGGRDAESSAVERYYNASTGGGRDADSSVVERYYEVYDVRRLSEGLSMLGREKQTNSCEWRSYS